MCVVVYSRLPNEEFGRADRFYSIHADETRCSLAHALTKGSSSHHVSSIADDH